MKDGFWDDDEDFWSDDDAEDAAPQAPAIQGEVLTVEEVDRMSRGELLTKDEHGLTPRQRLFVQAYMTAGGSASAAARAAGVPTTQAHVVGSRWMRSDAVLRAVRRELGVTLIAASPALLREQIRLALHARSEFVRQQAGGKLIDMAKLGEEQSTTRPVRVIVDLS